MTKPDGDIDALARAYKRLRKRKLKLKLLKSNNPYLAGTLAHTRWKLLFKWAKREARLLDYFNAGGNPETLQNALRKRHVEVNKSAAKKKASRSPGITDPR